MIYTEQTMKALKLCYEAHKDQVDKTGMPYIFHPFHLAEQMEDELSATVALLHDVVEDTDYTLEDLREIGFSPEVLEAVALMTHDPAVPYEEYLIPIKENPIACRVKLVDLAHNSDPSRIREVTPEMVRRWEKYRKAIAFLSSPHNNPEREV